MDHDKPVIEIKGIKKGFYGVPVLKGIDLKFYKGECVSLIGENGAGKSTLIKILCGVYTKDEGQVYLNGVEQQIHDAEEAKKFGISVIYQELSLFPDLKVYENIFINNELLRHSKNGEKNLKGAPLDIAKMKIEAAHVLHDRLHVDVDVNAKVKDIPFSQKQMVEIARAVYADSQIIFMDEPTTALEDKEKKTLFSIISELKKQEKTIIFISHHLDEIFANCERTIVLRDGFAVLEKNTCDLTEAELVQAMIGKQVDNYYPKVKFPILEDKILSVEHLTKHGVYEDISFNVHKNEIVGIIGLAGCGKYEIARSLFGIIQPDEGEIKLNGNTIRNKNIADAMGKKIAFLPSERKTESIFPNRDIRWNMTVADLANMSNKKGLDLVKEKLLTTKYVNDLKIKITSQTQPISSLSGGNQQKVILGRWFMKHPELLILEEPTRGIDVNAKTEVYKLIMDYVGNGHGVIVVSSEEEEVYGICDKIVVIHNGKISGVLKRDDITLQHLKTITKFSKASEGIG
jgi:ribose transport system ATP-binding protein